MLNLALNIKKVLLRSSPKKYRVRDRNPFPPFLIITALPSFFFLAFRTLAALTYCRLGGGGS